MNVTFISGNLGKDAEVKSRDNGSKYLSFSLANTEKKYNGEKQTTWYNCTMNVFGDGGPKLADYLKKGTRVAVIGRTAERTGDNGEIVHYFNVTDIELLSDGGKKDGNTAKKDKNRMNDDEDIF